MGWFDNYLKRAQARKINNMGYNQSKPFMQALSLENQLTRNSIEGQNNPGLTGELLRQRASGAMQGQAERMFDAERSQVAAENREIDSGISDAIAKHEAEKEAERKAKKDAWAKTALKFGGTALGAIVGSVVPGAGTMLGAQIGAGLGGAASSFVGGGGKMALNNINQEELQMGVQDTLSGINSAVSLNRQKKDIEDISGFMKANIGKDDPTTLSTLKMLDMAIASNNMELVRQIIGGK